MIANIKELSEVRKPKIVLITLNVFKKIKYDKQKNLIIIFTKLCFCSSSREKEETVIFQWFK